MKPLRSLALLTVLVPFAAGCAARTAPFDTLDQAQVTVLRLSAPQQQATPAGPALPTIPGVPPEWAQMGQQAMQGLGGMIPGLGGALPGMIPGAQQPQQPPLPQFKGFSIVAQQPADDQIKDELLDIFGHE